MRTGQTPPTPTLTAGNILRLFDEGAISEEEAARRLEELKAVPTFTPLPTSTSPPPVASPTMIPSPTPILEEQENDVRWRDDIPALETAVHQMISDYRQQHGQAALIYNEDIIAAQARKHSVNMASYHKSYGLLIHAEEIGPDPFQNTRFGCGENVLAKPRANVIYVRHVGQSHL